LSVSVRSGPVMTAVNGTLVARPAGTNLAQAWRRWLPSSGDGREVRPRTSIRLVGWRAGASRMCAQGVSLWMKVKAADGFSVLLVSPGFQAPTEAPCKDRGRSQGARCEDRQ
jgi:hypothetical protein